MNRTELTFMGRGGVTDLTRYALDGSFSPAHLIISALGDSVHPEPFFMGRGGSNARGPANGYVLNRHPAHLIKSMFRRDMEIQFGSVGPKRALTLFLLGVV